MLDDPRVNFAINTRGERKGLDHLGIQVEDDAELGEVYSRLKNAGARVIEERSAGRLDWADGAPYSCSESGCSLAG